jgi:hypothetical protein
MLVLQVEQMAQQSAEYPSDTKHINSGTLYNLGGE